MTYSILLYLSYISLVLLPSSTAFSLGVATRTTTQNGQTLQSSQIRHTSPLQSAAKEQGDPLRAATGIRPSLHPVTINAIAEALKIRSQNLKDLPLRPADGVEPLQIALSAGRIATEAIQKRQQASDEDGMKLEAKEEQTVAGRVVGVCMRFSDLEEALVKKCEAVSWIAKYGEWASFGLVGETEAPGELDDRIKDDPLFRMSRAECLLALFLDTVEKPSLAQSGESVPGGSVVDFLDADRKEVLLSEGGGFD